MGSGRSELARIMFGLDPHKTGQIHVKGTDLDKLSPATSIEHGMAFVTENRRLEGLLMDASVSENLDLVALDRFTKWGPARIIDRPAASKAAYEMAASLQIKSGPIGKHPAKNLSGGNQQKAVIGKWLLTDPVVLILDEPTRGIDVGAKYEVYGIINDLAARGTGILYISSEIEELLGMCDRIVVMRNGRIEAEFPRTEFDQERILQAAFGSPSERDSTAAHNAG
jgi:ABC-type sugar transport system ATPase subunit